MAAHTAEDWRKWLYQGLALTSFACAHGLHGYLYRGAVLSGSFDVLGASNALMVLGLLLLAALFLVLDKTRHVVLNRRVWTSRPFVHRYGALSVLFVSVRVAEKYAVTTGTPSDALYVLRCVVPSLAVFFEFWALRRRLRRVHLLPLFVVLTAIVMEIPRIAFPLVGPDSSAASFFWNALIALADCSMLVLLAQMLAPAPGAAWDAQDVVVCFSLSTAALLAVLQTAMGDWGALSALWAALGSAAAWRMGALVLLVAVVHLLRVVALQHTTVLAVQVASFTLPLMVDYYSRSLGQVGALAPVMGTLGVAALVAASTPRMSKRTPEQEREVALRAPATVQLGVTAVGGVLAVEVVFLLYVLLFELNVRSVQDVWTGAGGDNKPGAILLVGLATFALPLGWLLLRNLRQQRAVEWALYGATSVLLLHLSVFPYDIGPLGFLVLLLLRGLAIALVAGAVEAAKYTAQQEVAFDDTDVAPMPLA